MILLLLAIFIFVVTRFIRYVRPRKHVPLIKEPLLDSAVTESKIIIDNEKPQIDAGNVFFYYKDLRKAEHFYGEILGLKKVRTYGTRAAMYQIGSRCFLTLVNAEHGRHKASEPKTAAIALLTDDISTWWKYASAHSEIKKRTKSFIPNPNVAHNSFVLVDPEGYLVEIEQFNLHPENKKLMERLDQIPVLPTSLNVANKTLGFKASIVWFYYRNLKEAQGFYEQTIGLDLMVDQGWAKVYPIGHGGSLFGIVSEVEGMHRYTRTKAVSLSILTSHIDRWFMHLKSSTDTTIQTTPHHDGDHVEFFALDKGLYDIEFDQFDEPL